MPSLKLTARGVEHVKPPKRGRVEYWDAALPGFGLRVTHTGSRSWVAMFRAGGRLRRGSEGEGEWVTALVSLFTQPSTPVNSWGRAATKVPPKRSVRKAQTPGRNLPKAAVAPVL